MKNRGCVADPLLGTLKVERCISFLEPLGATWTILEAIRGPAGRQGAPKIKHFRTKTPKSQEKWRPGECLEKTLKFHRNLMRKCEVLGTLNHGISWVLVCNYSVGAFFVFFVKVLKTLRKCMPKWLPKCSKIELGGALGRDFWGFGRSWKEVDFWCVFGWTKSRPKMTKVRHMGGQRCLGW